MTLSKFSNLLPKLAALLLFPFCSAALAQGPALDAPTAPAEPVSVSAVVMPQPVFETHKFLDRKNSILFAAVAASSAADFAVTRANLQSGGQELNPIVRVFGRSTPALAVNFAGETAGVIAVSYFFHKTGHHELEHLISYVNIGSSAGAVSYGLAHR
ncbi:MAG: hypothetical protein WA477_03760 [Candidatus Sulfotelmatobacter sp.]